MDRALVQGFTVKDLERLLPDLADRGMAPNPADRIARLYGIPSAAVPIIGGGDRPMPDRGLIIPGKDRR
jgi:hypothetical protein